MFKSFWGSPEQQAQPRPQEVSMDSWYQPSTVNSQGSSRPATPSASPRPEDRSHSLSHVSPAEAAGIIATLKDKSVDELRKLLSDKDAYHNFLLSLEPVKTHNRVRGELINETVQFSRGNREKEPRIMELRNQCRIIRTSELAAALETLHEAERKTEEIMKFRSPESLLYSYQEAMNETEEESEALHRQLLDQKIDIPSFVQKYKKLRNTYHQLALIHLAARTGPKWH